MRFILPLILLLCLPAFGEVEGESPEVVRAKQEMERVRSLVNVGALPPARLRAAQETLDEAADEAVLRRTLYGPVSADSLVEQQGEEMVSAALRLADRQRARLEREREIVEEGAAPRQSLAPLEEELDRRRRVVELATTRAQLLREISIMARSSEFTDEQPSYRPMGLVEKFAGSVVFGNGHLEMVTSAYLERFGRHLPISAHGDTAVHRALGFDHRGRVDVALDPDRPEGVWLRRFLEQAGISYYAFRSAVPGRSTAPHIHIGPASAKIRGGS